MEQLIPRLTGRSGEQAKLRKAKQALKSRIEPELQQLKHWLADGYVGFDRLPPGVQQLSEAVNQGTGWTVGALAACCALVTPRLPLWKVLSLQHC